MPQIRGNPGAKWQRRAAGASQDYEAGVRSPRVSWQAATIAAAPAQAAAVQAAISRQAFQKGVQRSGDAKWQEKSVKKGAPRFADGVQQSEADYSAGVAPYLQTIESTPLPPRGPKGDPKNYQRVVVLGTALRNKKLSMT